MLPEPPLPDLESPRVLAAMRVMGVEAQELAKREPAEMGAPARYELMETKRRTLIQQINGLASKGPDSVQLASSASLRSANSTFMQQVLEAEQKNFERMQMAAKSDVQKVVIEELETKLQMQQTAKKMEEGAQRMKQLTKSRDEKLAQLKKEAQKRAEKNADVRAKAARQAEREAEELKNQLTEANEKAERKIETIAVGREEARQQAHEKQLLIAERQAKLEQAQLRLREKQYDGIVAKHEAKIEKLNESLLNRQSQSEVILRKQQESMERVRNHWEEKQRQTEERYMKILDRHDGAKQKRVEKADVQAKEIRVRNAKERNAFVARYERIVKDLENHPNVSRRLKYMESTTIGERSLSDSQISALQMRGHHAELVNDNRDRLRRAHHHSQEQQLAKLAQMRQRVEDLEDCKVMANTRRMGTLKNCAIEKHRLENEVFKIKSAKPEKMVPLLDTLEPDPEASERIKEIMGQLGLQQTAGGGEEADRS